MNTKVLALSQLDTQVFRSNEDYVVISIADPGEHVYLHWRPQMKARLKLSFHDTLPEDAVDIDGRFRYLAMTEEQAAELASFVKSWFGRVATIVVHCYSGLSRSPAVAAAIARHFELDDRACYAPPRLPNRHCYVLTGRALQSGAYARTA